MNDGIDQTVGLPCRTPECPNMAAIFAGGYAYMCDSCASREARRRQRSRRPTLDVECQNGHQWADGTWRINSQGTRICRICEREASRRYKERQRSS